VGARGTIRLNDADRVRQVSSYDLYLHWSVPVAAISRRGMIFPKSVSTRRAQATL
jgi:hypothetical protein